MTPPTSQNQIQNRTISSSSNNNNTQQEKPTKMTTMLTATTTGGGGGKASSLTCLHHSSPSSSSSSLSYPFSTALHFKKFPHQVFSTSKLTNNTPVLVDESASDASSTSSSASTSRRSADWKAAKAYKQSGFIFEGRIEGFNGGGFLVRFFSLLGFLPFPQLSPSHSCKEPQKSIHEVAKSLNGSRISVKIIQADEEKRKLIFSEKEASWTKYSDKVNVGDVFPGKVGTVEDYGAFIHLRFPDGLYHLTGLVHVSEVSWDLVQDVRDVLSEGDDVRVKVIRVDREKSRITLSIKQLEEDPLLETLDKVIPQDDSIGSDSSSTDNGSDIEPLPGLASIFEELLQEDGIDDVRITRQGFEKRVVSQDLQLWLSNAPPTERKFTLLARAGRQVQEIQLTTFLDQEGIKKALQRVLERVP